MTPKEIIAKGIEICGSRTELASHLDVSTSSIDKWRIMNSIPVRHCSVLYRLTGIPLWEMNPDVFDPELTLSEPWLIRIVKLLRQLDAPTDPNFMRSLEVMLQLEVGDVDSDTESG